MTTVAVTGASGFIGQYVLAELAARGVGIVAATRSAGRLESWRDRAEILEIDNAAASSEGLDRLAHSDVLIHLAWETLPRYRSLHHFEVELPKQYHFLKSVIAHGMAAMVAAGTCFEYGLQSGELSEDCPSCPATPYGLAKDTLRRQLEFLRHDQPFGLTWARLFYTFGDGQAAGSLYPQIVAAVARGDKTFDMSAGEQLRDYLPAAEVARLLVELALGRADVGVVNVCAGEPVSIRRLVEGWVEKNGWDIKLNFGRRPYPDYEPLAFWGARRKLDRLCQQT